MLVKNMQANIIVYLITIFLIVSNVKWQTRAKSTLFVITK